MARHRRSSPPFVRRGRYLRLLAAYEELERHYRELARNHDRLVHLDRPAPRRAPAWAETTEIPVITTAGLDTEKAAALLRRWGMAGSPAGSFQANRGTTG
jgi:hypothetical protein